jgi:uncharacterized repeat protein (TIGR03803 family)
MKAVWIALFVGMVGWNFEQPGLATEATKFKEEVLWSFGSVTDGQYPSDLIDLKSSLYGTTGEGGTYGLGAVFSVDPKTRAEAVLYSFAGGAGVYPNGVIAVKGNLYGTTLEGGTNGEGTAFVVDRKTGVEKVLYSFCSQPKCADGAYPFAVPIDLNGSLYGTTNDGGIIAGDCGGGCGTVFSLDPATGVETVLYSFCQQQSHSRRRASRTASFCADGEFPISSLISVGGTLYGITEEGGANDSGAVFSLDPSTGVETVLYSFCNLTNCADGRSPQASLIYVNGMLFGTTTYGGAYNDAGTVFSVDASTGTESVLYSFCSQQSCADGQAPRAQLIEVDGILYGTTLAGGVQNRVCGGVGCGTAFSLDPTTGVENVLYSFCSQENCADGWEPLAGLLAMKSKLYGTTGGGGSYGFGTVFSLKQQRQAGERFTSRGPPS